MKKEAHSFLHKGGKIKGMTDVDRTEAISIISNHFLLSFCGLMSFLDVKCGNVYKGNTYLCIKDKEICYTHLVHQIRNSQHTGLNNHWARFHGVNEVLSAQQIMYFPFS